MGRGHWAVESPVRPPKPRPLWLTQGRKLRQGWDGGAGSWPRGAGWAREARMDPAPTAVRRQARPPSLCVVRGLAPVAPLVLLPASGDLVQLLRRLPVDGPVPAPGERGRGSPREQSPRSCGPPPTRPAAGGPWAAGQGSGAGRRHGPVPLVSGGCCGNRLLHQTGKRPLGTHRWPDAPGRPVARSTGLGAVGGCRAPLGLE